MCSILLQPVAQRLVSCLPFFNMCLFFSTFLCSTHMLTFSLVLLFSLIFQTIDMILSMHQDNVPIRFGIIMYSSRFINVIEDNDGSKSEDTSTLVNCFFQYFITVISFLVYYLSLTFLPLFSSPCHLLVLLRYMKY
jgi:hypothetical protein